MARRSMDAQADAGVSHPLVIASGAHVIPDPRRPCTQRLVV
jgi:hypothetical protein